MPPNKKKRKLNAKPSVTQDYLSANFSKIDSSSPILNGHVLHLYLENEKSYARTKTSLASSNIFPDIENYNITYSVQKLVKSTYGKFKKLSDSVQFSKFVAICAETFECVLDSKPKNAKCVDTVTSPLSVRIQNASIENLKESTSVPLHSTPEENVIQTRHSCTNCDNLKISLTESVSKRKTLFSRVQQLQRQHQPIKVLNQKLKRRDEQIQKLKRSIREQKVAKDLKELQKQHSALKRNHNRVKSYRKDNFGVSEKKSKAKAKETIDKLKKCIDNNNNTVKALEIEKDCLAEKIVDLELGLCEYNDNVGRAYSATVRLGVYDSLINSVPTQNIPTLLQQFTSRFNTQLDEIPCRSTVEMMARELGVMAQLQVAEFAMANKNLTLGFDATTQEGVHINSVHLTSPTDCLVIAIDELPGGTAQDYADHITESVADLSNVYCAFHGGDTNKIKSMIIDNISNCLTDRCAANHKAVEIINSNWGKTLIELKCHLHPLDTIATSVQTSLKKCENMNGLLFGKGCLSGNIVVQMNKLRYKDGKGDPRGFKTFLSENDLPKGLLPRYRGNRLHILFHLCGIYFQHYPLFENYLKLSTSCGGLRASLLHDFGLEETKVQLQVLGLIGKFLTGPWMEAFYTSAKNQMNHLDGISIIREVITVLENYSQNPLDIFSSETDFFGNTLKEDDTLSSLLQPPANSKTFIKMMTSSLESTINVLNRQYKNYFAMDVTPQLQQQTKSARSHNIDAEEIMGMFSSALQKSPNATLCYLSSKLRAQKNKTVQFLESKTSDDKENIIKISISLARKKRVQRRKRQQELQSELTRRQAVKRQERDQAKRIQLERKLKNVESFEDEFTELSDSQVEELKNIVDGKLVGRELCHMWADSDGSLQLFNGKVEKFRKKGVYRIGYWLQGESYSSDATDYDVSCYALAADFILGDLEV